MISLIFTPAAGNSFLQRRGLTRMLSEYLIDPIDAEFELLNEVLPYD